MTGRTHREILIVSPFPSFVIPTFDLLIGYTYHPPLPPSPPHPKHTVPSPSPTIPAAFWHGRQTRSAVNSGVTGIIMAYTASSISHSLSLCVKVCIPNVWKYCFYSGKRQLFVQRFSVLPVKLCCCTVVICLIDDNASKLKVVLCLDGPPWASTMN